MKYNLYCDESCHLEHDNNSAMVLGCVWCPKDKVREINKKIVEIKNKYGVHATSEIKWTKISNCKENLYVDIVNYFFAEQNLHFRALVIPDKSKLKHENFNQTHDLWYYKMYFDMIKTIFSRENEYEVYIDIKDTHSTQNVHKLQEVTCHSIYDFSETIIKRIQPIRSEEVQLMQITDILIGALAFYHRKVEDDVKRNKTKLQIIELIKEKSNYTLDKTTLLREDKFNFLIWRAQEGLEND